MGRQQYNLNRFTLLKETAAIDDGYYGGINCALNFDDDLYEEYLQDNDLQDTPEVKKEYAKNECDWDIEYLDGETWHACENKTLNYSEMEDDFGERLASEILNDCMDESEHSYEFDLYRDDDVDIQNPKSLNAAAKKVMATVDSPCGKFRGWILTDGTVLNAGWDHNACFRISPEIKYREDFTKLGNVRFSDVSLEFGKYPTTEQLQMVREFCDYHSGDDIYVDFLGGKNGRADKKYHGLDYSELKDDLYNYYAYGSIGGRGGMFEAKIKKIVAESVRGALDFLLLEGDDRLKRVNRIIDVEFGNLLNLDGPVSDSEYYVGGNPETTWRQYLMFSLRHTFGLMTNQDVQYLPLVAKLAFSDKVGFEKRNDNGTQLSVLLKMVQLLKKDNALFQRVKANIDSVTFESLYQELKPQLEHIAATDSEAANAVEERNDYDIVEVNDFETAKYYGDRSCSESKLCYTQSVNTWDSYTKNGLNKVYVCLVHGWEGVPEVATERNPYDTYGTSMIFVFIDPEGNISTSNCRWNHYTEGQYNGDVDHAFTKTTLAETVGVPFDKVFKPHTKEKLRAMGYIQFDEVQGLLDEGMNPKELFSSMGYFNDGFARVRLNSKFNFINKKGKLLSNQWLDRAGDFEDGFAAVGLNGKCNFLTKEGKLLSNQWFDSASNFYYGFALIRLDNRFNFLTKKGNLLSNLWFDYVGFFRDSFAAVGLNNKYNFINKDGKLLSNQWFDDVYSFKDGLARVELNGKWGSIDRNGKLYMNESKHRQVTISESDIRGLVVECVRRLF